MFQKASLKGRASMSEVSIIGIDLAKPVHKIKIPKRIASWKTCPGKPLNAMPIR
jgi:hypothetical protein